MSEKPPEKPGDSEGEKDPSLYKIRMADFEDPRPFETRPGAFHPYTYIPLIGWLTPTELNIILFVLAMALALGIPVAARFLQRRAEARNLQGLSELRVALERYHAATKDRPASLGELADKGFIKAVPLLKLTPHHGSTSLASVGPAADDSADWRYAPPGSSSAPGNVFVNCTHTDRRGTVWSSY